MSSTNEITREEIEELYEEETGLDARRGSGRVDRLQKFIADNGLALADVTITNDTRKIGRDYRKGIRWSAGTVHGDTCLLGYTSDRGIGQYKNVIFASSNKIEIDV